MVEGMQAPLAVPFLMLLFMCWRPGPLIFGLLAAGLAIGMAVTFSAASMFLLLPLFGGALLLGGIGFGLSAGAFLLPGLVFSFFNLVSFGLPSLLGILCAACSMQRMCQHESGNKVGSFHMI